MLDYRDWEGEAMLAEARIQRVGRETYNQGHRAGYERGEGERIALAEMNDKLKHLLRCPWLGCDMGVEDRMLLDEVLR